MKLNLGCGKKILDGYVNVDITPSKGVQVMDVCKLPYPFPNEHFEEILTVNCIEHLSIDTDLLMKELHRILKPDGVIRIRVPHYTNPANHFTQHKKLFSSRSFDGYFKNSTYDFHYDFSFTKITKRIDFVRGFASVYNIPVEWIANKGIARFYEGTPLSVFPAKGIWFGLVK